MEREHTMHEVVKPFPTWAVEGPHGMANLFTLAVEDKSTNLLTFEPLTPKALERLVWSSGLTAQTVLDRLHKGIRILGKYNNYDLANKLRFA